MPRSKRLRPIRVRALWPIVLSASLLACTAQTNGTYREIYQSVHAEDLSTAALTERLELAMQDRLGPDLEYRVSDRIIRTDSKEKIQQDTEREARLLHEPILDLFLTAGTLYWTQGYEHRQDRRDRTDSPTNTLSRYQVFQRLDWNPVDLPSMTAWTDYRTQEDDFFLDRDEQRTVFEVQDTRGPLSALYNLEYRSVEDNASDSELRSLEHIFRSTYDETFFDERLATRSTVFLNSNRTTERSPAGSTLLAANQVVPISGLFAVDRTPSLGSLPTNAALIDGNETTSAGINIGGTASGGGPDRNIGVELPTAQAVDTVLLFTVDEVSFLFENQFTFSVWSSNDNLTWRLVTSSATYVYETGLLRFNLQIPRVSARYLKVVNTFSPAAAPAVLISEMEVFEPRTLLTPKNKVDSDLDTANVTSSLTWRQTDRLSFTYDLLLQRRTQERDGIDLRDEKRFDQALSSLWTITDTVDLVLRTEQRRLHDPETFDEIATQYSGLLTHRPFETLDLTASYSDGSLDRDHDRFTRTSAALVRAAAQLLPTLDAELSFERTVQKNADTDLIIRRNIISAGMFAELTPDWNLSVVAREELASTSGTGAGAFPDPDETFVETILTYQPNDQLTMDAQLDWRNVFAGSGLDQRYRIDWVPFPDGMLDIQFDAARISDDLTDMRTYILQTLARWTFNSRLYLDGTYNVQFPSDQDRIETLSLVLHYGF